MAVLIEELQEGDILTYWHDTGCCGAEIGYARVLKVGRNRVRVRSEFGHEAWKNARPGEPTGWQLVTGNSTAGDQKNASKGGGA